LQTWKPSEAEIFSIPVNIYRFYKLLKNKGFIAEKILDTPD